MFDFFDEYETWLNNKPTSFEVTNEDIEYFKQKITREEMFRDRIINDLTDAIVNSNIAERIQGKIIEICRLYMTDKCNSLTAKSKKQVELLQDSLVIYQLNQGDRNGS